MPKLAAALILAALAASSVASTVQAQSLTAYPRRRDPCVVDAMTYCPNVSGVHGAMRQCLALHATKLSVACRAAMTQVPGGGR